MKLWRSPKYINISCNTLLWLVPEETLILENASLKLLNSTQMNRMEMGFPSRQAQPCWFPRTAHGIGAIPFLFEVLHPQHQQTWPNDLALLDHPKHSLCQALAAAQPRLRFFSHPTSIWCAAQTPHIIRNHKMPFSPFLRDGAGMCVQQKKKKISPQHTNPSLKQCKSSFSLYGSPLIFHTSANSGQGWTDLRKGLGVLWKSLQVQSCVCI